MISGYDLVALWREYRKLDSGQVTVDINIGDYRGYVAGVCDVCNCWLFTTPEGTTQGQVCEVVGKWLELHPLETGKQIRIQQALSDKMKMTPEQIGKACKLGECSPK